MMKSERRVEYVPTLPNRISYYIKPIKKGKQKGKIEVSHFLGY